MSASQRPVSCRFRLASLVAASVLAAYAPALSAKTTRNTLNVRVDVDTSCRMTTEPLAFGTVNIFSGQVDATATIRLRCGPAVAYSVALDNGRYFNGQRRMSNGGGFFTYVPYQIYRNAARTQVWGATPATMVNGVTPANGQATLTAYGRVPNSIVMPMAYADVVTVTVNF